jgi:hypothetical protein
MREEKGISRFLLVLTLSGLLCAAMMAVVAAGEVKTSCGSKGWYFAEGYTGGDFDTWILIQNPNKVETTAHLRFFTPQGEPISMDVKLKKEARFSLLLNNVPGLEKQEVATEVICDGEGVVAERAMYFNYYGKAGGHATIGADSTSYSWFMPEGYTGGDFDTYVLLMNPNDANASCYVKLMKPGEGKYYPFKVTVPAGRRVTVKVDDLVWKEGTDNIIAASEVLPAGGTAKPGAEVKFDNTDVSTYVASDKPIVAERAMYFNYYGKAGGSGSIAAPCTAERWFLPEGYTGSEFDTWVSAMNPSGNTLDITYTFYTNQPGAEPVSVVHSNVAPWSRDTIHVNDIPQLVGKDVATEVTATRPVQLAGAEGPKKFAVLYGIDKYAVDPLKYAVDDLYDVKHRLVDNCGFSYDYMRYRSDEGVTLAKLQEDMAWLASEAGPEDLVVFFFGGKSGKAAENYLQLYDGNVTKTELNGYFSALQSKQLGALLNCDNSGEIAGELSAAGRAMVAGCGAGEKVYEYPEADFAAASGDYGNGAFPYYFVEALGKKAADSSGNGKVSLVEAFNYLEPKVKALASSKGVSQNPKMFLNIADLDLTVERVAASIVAERSVYFKYGASAEGATSIGACSTYPSWFLAEGYTGGAFDTYVLVLNPYDYPQKVTATFMTPDGSTVVKEYDVPGRYRLTIKVDDVEINGVKVLANTDVSTQIDAEPIETSGVKTACGDGVVAERAMYFTYTDPNDGSRKSGGSCSIGYGSW